MLEEKHLEALCEAHETIEDALRDSRGLLAHQRRLMALLSLGAAHLIEYYLHRLRAIKAGASIKHQWFKADARRISLMFAGVLTKSLERLPAAERVVELAHKLEIDRDDIVYGSPLTSDRVLREKIDIFLELKKTIEKVVGEIKW